LYGKILEAVSRYEWRAAGRDVLKDLYHNTIPPRLRHDYGEYYTPDWLAQAICEEVMDEEWCRSALINTMNGIYDHTVMDPSCGSGTFLYHAVRRLQDVASRIPGLAGDQAQQSEIITRIVVGIDIHPVAVELAKATKAMALARVTRSDGSSNNVFLGDSVQWDAKTEARALGVILTQIPVDDKKNVFLPSGALLEGDVEGQISAFFKIAETPEEEFRPEAAVELFDAVSSPEYQSYVLDACRFFHREIIGHRNHVWKYYLLNLIQPFKLRQRARLTGSSHHALLVGNPPWVVYNSIKDTGRQDEFRRHAAERGVWSGGRLATQNDLAATFVAACVDHYLGNGGKFGFVLPYSAIRGRHWEAFRTGQWYAKKNYIESRTASLSGAWDLFGVKDPPFPQADSCVMFGSKSKTSSKLAPDTILAFRNKEGKRVVSSMRWSAARLALDTAHQRTWKTAKSTYLGKFRNGATLFPQALAVCDPDETFVRKVYTTFRTRESKGTWAGLTLDGKAENQFVYAGVFSKNIVPFGLAGVERVIAPDIIDGRLRSSGLPDGKDASLFRNYWTVANLKWSERRQRTAPPTLAEQLDYNGKFSSQFSARVHSYRVVYNKSGSVLQSAVIPSTIDGHPVVVDGTAYWYSSKRLDELHYLCAVLNAACLREFFSGACRMSNRDFHTGPLEYCPIRTYDARDSIHRRLAHLSRACRSRVATMPAGGSGLSRRDVMGDEKVAAAMLEIDVAVRRLLPGQASGAQASLCARRRRAARRGPRPRLSRAVRRECPAPSSRRGAQGARYSAAGLQTTSP
ncbi:MAG: SAM-dependent DNA methyltransferase, partial [Thaumarchaeota archaeon S13]